jgi:dephospho-CoA kinase
VFDAPLLIELGEHREMDQVVVVTCQENQQIERLRERMGMTEEEARKVISSQTPLEDKVKLADFIIRNEGSIEETRRRAKEVFQELKRIALLKNKRS